MHRFSFMLTLVISAIAAAPLAAQSPTPSAATKRFITVDAAITALTHVRVIDGTGTGPREDQTVVLSDGRISAVGATGSIVIPANATVIDATGKSVLPGLVFMHEHLFYPSRQGAIWHEQANTFLRLYLGAGITTMRTAGSMEPYTDLNLKKYVNAGKLPGPSIDVTGPYLTGVGLEAPQLVELASADESRRTVATWAERGVTSFKAYMHITRDELGAAITEAHKHGIKVTGHICSVTFREAALLGIDNLEHGLPAATDFLPGKALDTCPGLQAATAANATLDVTSDAVKSLIRLLVDRKVAITSTLPVFETVAPGRPPIGEQTLASMSPETRAYIMQIRASIDQQPPTSANAGMLKTEMAFERAFVAAGGVLLAGTDPTGYGAAIPGYGGWRELELLVEAGFTPVEAISIGTRNGATYLGQQGEIGTIAVGKRADLVLVAGNPAASITDIEKAETVFKGGIGYDSTKLMGASKGMVGL